MVAVTPMASLGGTNPYMAQRMMGMVHAAMFDAVNSIERRYRPYLVQLPAAAGTSSVAAAAAAAATLLATVDEKTAGEMKGALATYLASIPDSAAKSDGVKLGEAIAAKVLEARAKDGCDAPDDYRPKDNAWRLRSDGDHHFLDVAKRQTICHDQPIAIPPRSRRFRWRVRTGRKNTTRSKSMADRKAPSERTSRPRLPDSGLSAHQPPTIRLHASW